VYEMVAYNFDVNHLNIYLVEPRQAPLLSQVLKTYVYW